jgi:hypothetical protein
MIAPGDTTADMNDLDRDAETSRGGWRLRAAGRVAISDLERDAERVETAGAFGWLDGPR